MLPFILFPFVSESLSRTPWNNWYWHLSTRGRLRFDWSNQGSSIRSFRAGNALIAEKPVSQPIKGSFLLFLGYTHVMRQQAGVQNNGKMSLKFCIIIHKRLFSLVFCTSTCSLWRQVQTINIQSRIALNYKHTRLQQAIFVNLTTSSGEKYGR